MRWTTQMELVACTARQNSISVFLVICIQSNKKVCWSCGWRAREKKIMQIDLLDLHIKYGKSTKLFVFSQPGTERRSPLGVIVSEWVKVLHLQIWQFRNTLESKFFQKFSIVSLTKCRENVIKVQMRRRKLNSFIFILFDKMPALLHVDCLRNLKIVSTFLIETNITVILDLPVVCFSTFSYYI